MWKAEVDGRPPTFHLAGINNQNFIMEDEETGSWWQQVTGEAIHGPLAGKRLELVFHDELTFDTWRRENPGGRVLRPDDSAPWRKFSDDWETKTAKYPVVTPAGKGEPLPPREIVLGVKAGGAARAYPLSAVLRQSPLVDTLGGVPLVLVAAEDGKSVRAFECRVDGREMELFARPGAAPLRLVDAATGSEWDFAGAAVSGPLAGKQLARVYLLKDYWFDWKIYNPGTSVYRPGPR